MNTKTYSLLILGAMLLIAYSCSPVKTVLSTPKYYDQVKRQVILRGECANDTVTKEVIIDNVVYKDTVVHDSFRVLMPAECKLDTIVNDFSVYLENGNMWVKWLGKIPERTIQKKTTHIIIDRAKEAILLDSCDNQTREIYSLNNKISTQKKQKFKLLAIIAILAILLFRKPLLRLVKPF